MSKIISGTTTAAQNLTKSGDFTMKVFQSLIAVAALSMTVLCAPAAQAAPQSEAAVTAAAQAGALSTSHWPWD